MARAALPVSLPWVESHRPTKLTDVVGNDVVLCRLAALAKDGHTPHLLLKGPPGCGKTASALCFARELLQDATNSGTLLQLNASDTRSSGTLLPLLHTFLDAPMRSSTTVQRIVLLDEADSLLPDAQDGVRMMLDAHEATTRFMLLCNSSASISEALQGKMVILQFRELSALDMMTQLQRVCVAEELVADTGGLKAVIHAAEGDMRRAVNILQVVHASGRVVSEDTVYQALAALHRGALRDMMRLVHGLSVAGVTPLDVVQCFRNVVLEAPSVQDVTRVALLEEFARTYARLLDGLNGRVQLACLCGRMMERVHIR